MPTSVHHRFIAAAAIALPLLPGSSLRGTAPVHAQAPAVAAQTNAPERRIVLQGAANFRDLGGYAAADGRHVRWGMIYRSGALSRLTAADYDQLSRLGIAVVCDFRRESERTAAPTAWKGANPPVILNLPGTQANRGSDDEPAPGAAATTATAAAPASGLSTLLVTSYPTYPTTLGGSYRTVLQQLMTQKGAVLYHCTAGKDRTGTFSAMLLTMLGVPRQVVMDDYLLSNQYVVSQARIDAVVARGGTRESAIATIGVDRAYLELMFKAIDKDYGSFDEYRRKVLGISDADLTTLKAKLLE